MHVQHLTGSKLSFKRSTSDVRLLRDTELDSTGYPVFDGAPAQGGRGCLIALAETVAISALPTLTDSVVFEWIGPNFDYNQGTRAGEG